MVKRPSTQPRRKADDGSINALFSGAADPSMDTDLQAEASKSKGEDPNAALLAQIAALNSRVEELSKVSNFTMQSAPVMQTLKEPVLDLSGLPDPQYDNDAYSAGVAKRTQDHIKATLAYQQAVADAARSSEQSQTKKAESLWEDFQSAYPDHSTNDKLVLFAAQQVSDGAKARGIDPEKFMFGNRTQFMKEVAETMDSIRGTPFGKDRDEEPEVETRDDDGEATRTAGLFGNGTTIPRARDDTKALAGDMISDLRDTQRKSGFF